MNHDVLERAKKVYWVLWMLSLVSAISVMIYLLTFSWRIYGLLTLMSLTFGAFSLSRIVEYICLQRVYKDNDTDFTVPRLFQKKNRVINPNNVKGKVIWFFSTVPFIVFTLLLVILILYV